MSDVTRVLTQIEAGDPAAAEQLLPLVYDELRKLAAIVLVVALAPILYVASIGPVAWMGGREMISTDEDSVVMVIYAPLQYAADHSTTADMALTWYVSLFLPIVTSQPAVYDPVASPAAAVYYDPVPQGAGVPTQRSLPASY